MATMESKFLIPPSKTVKQGFDASITLNLAWSKLVLNQRWDYWVLELCSLK